MQRINLYLLMFSSNVSNPQAKMPSWSLLTTEQGGIYSCVSDPTGTIVVICVSKCYLAEQSRLFIFLYTRKPIVQLETLRQEKVSYLSLAANYTYVYMRLFLLKLRKSVISKNLGKTLLPNVDRSSAAIILFCSKNTTCQRRQIVKLTLKTIPFSVGKSGQAKQGQCIPNSTPPLLPSICPNTWVVFCHHLPSEKCRMFDLLRQPGLFNFGRCN